MVIVVAFLGASCGGDHDRDEQLTTASALMDQLDLEVVEPPEITTSKSVRYATATGLAGGTQTSVIQDVSTTLPPAGWVIRSVGPIDVSSSSADQGDQVIVSRDGLVARVAVFDQIGRRPAPAGSRWVQLAVASPDDELAWTDP